MRRGRQAGKAGATNDGIRLVALDAVGSVLERPSRCGRHGNDGIALGLPHARWHMPAFAGNEERWRWRHRGDVKQAAEGQQRRAAREDWRARTIRDVHVMSDNGRQPCAVAPRHAFTAA